MPIIVEKLRIENCEITVDVWQDDGQPRKAILRFEYEAGGKKEIKEKPVMLENDPKSEQIPPTPKTGDVHPVVATLTTSSDRDSIDEPPLKFCDKLA